MDLGPHIHERETPDAYELTVAPDRVGSAPRVYFTLAWDLSLAFMAAVLVRGGVSDAAPFLIPFAVIGVLLTYSAVVALVCTRRLTIGNGRFAWRSRPLPAFGSFDFPIEQVACVVLGEKVTSYQGEEGTPTRGYFPAARLADGSTREIALGALDRAAAEHAAARLDDALQRVKRAPTKGPYRQ